jgi:hypothetical protein
MKSKTVEIKFFLLFWFVDGRIRIRTYKYGYGGLTYGSGTLPRAILTKEFQRLISQKAYSTVSIGERTVWHFVPMSLQSLLKALRPRGRRVKVPGPACLTTP